MIVRARSDLVVLRPLAAEVLETDAPLSEGVVFATSDNLFYASAATFVRTFSDVHDAFVARGYFRADCAKRVILPHWRHLAASEFDDNELGRACPTRWYWLSYPKAVFHYPKVQTAAKMLRILHLRLADAERASSAAAAAANATSGRLAYADFGPLCDRNTFPPVPLFCSESSFLHHCLEHGPVRPCAPEFARTVFLQLRAQRSPEKQVAVGGDEDLEAAFAAFESGDN